MFNFITGKITYGLLVLTGVVVVVFLLFNVLPGDPAKMTLGQRADMNSIEAINKELGLDKPLQIQFFLYLNDLSPVSIHENSKTNQLKYSFVGLFSVSKENILVIKFPYLKRSYQTKQLVSEILMDALPATVLLAVSSIILASITGIFFGVIAAVKHSSVLDNMVISLSVLGISLPSFFSAMLIAWIFGYLLSNFTGLDITGSLFTIDPSEGKILQLKNLILPMITLGLRPMAIITQLTRSAMLDVLSQDYVRTAVAKGLSYWTVLFKHALRNALNPVVTAVSGWFADLLAGAFFVEYIFNWKGLGYVTVKALEKSDFPVVMGSVLFTAFMFVTINILVDVLYGMLDPRISVKK